ncbi:hypothetical protein CEP53_012186 [Fusarium sp. AF-6]|nr:hypothetical protein CEP53_012186 [Fusarium sp. AF-6]
MSNCTRPGRRPAPRCTPAVLQILQCRLSANTALFITLLLSLLFRKRRCAVLSALFPPFLPLESWIHPVQSSIVKAPKSPLLS